MPELTADVDSIPTRRRYDPATGTLTIVCDVLPASVDDLRVLTGDDRVRVDVETDRRSRERTVLAPSDRRILADGGRAYYNNGVLEIAVETARRDRAPSR